MTAPDAAVAGGGLAGAATAWHLARAGASVTLFERERAPHDKVCGEFVSVEAGRHLEALADGPDAGSLLPALGASPIDRVRLVAGRVEAVAPLPFRGWGLSRRRLDAWTLGRAERAGVAVHLGRAVRLDAGGGTPTLRTADGPAPAGAVVLATGKHEPRGHKRRAGPSDAIGLKTHLRLSPDQDRALDGHVELALFEGGYAGLQRIEGGLANLCLVVSKARFAREGRDWRRLALSVPHLRRRLEGAAACWPRPLAVSGVPYGYLHRDEDGDPRAVYRVGDQLAVIPSFTGDGMAMALHSAGLAAAAALAGRPAASFHREAVRAFRPSVRLAGLVAAAGAPASAQPALALLCRAFPGLLTGLASRTRVRDPGTTPPCPTQS